MADEAAAPRSKASDERWKHQESGPAKKKGKGLSQRSWLIVLAGIVLALASVVIVWLLFIKPPPPPPFYLSITIADYNLRKFPVIPFTRQDGDRVLRHFPLKNLAETKTRELLQRELNGLATKSEPIIIHLTALALTRDDKVFVLPGDADPDDETTWLDVAEVLKAVAACPSPHKLLILDLAHPLADARLGVLTDRVAETLEEILTAEKPAYFVLCPCSAGQFSLASDALQCSVFAHYFDQALQGHADTNKDQRLMVKELFAFLEARVDRWAQGNRATRQKPRLFGSGEEFSIISVGRGSLGELAPTEPEPYPARLLDAWKARDAWWDKEAFRRAPRTLRKFEANLLRQDQQWRGGILHQKDLDASDSEPQLLLKELTRVMVERVTPPRSLPLALAPAGLKKDEAFANAARDILANAKPAGGKMDDNSKVEDELFKRLNDQKDAVFAQQGWAVMEALHRMPKLRPEHLTVARAAVVRMKPKQRYVEMLYVDRLIDFADRKDADAWRPKMMQGILHTLRARETVIGALEREPGLLPWLAATIEDGDELRRAAEQKLLWAGPSTWDDAFEKLQSAKDRYEEAQRGFTVLQRGRFHLDRAFAELPMYVHLLCDGPDVDAQAEQTWTKAVEEAEKLQTFFAAVPAKGAANLKSDVIAIDTPGRDLQRYLQILEKALRRRIEPGDREENADLLRQTVFLLDTALLKAPQRAALMNKQRTLGFKLNDANDQQDKDDNAKGRVLAFSDPARKVNQSQAGSARARMALALLRLAGANVESKKFVLPMAGDVVSSRHWTRLETQLHDACSKDLVAQWQGAKSPAAADALNRAVSPWERDRFEKDPSVQLQYSQREAFRQWLQARYQAEAAFLEKGQEPAPRIFFSEAAREIAN